MRQLDRADHNRTRKHKDVTLMRQLDRADHNRTRKHKIKTINHTRTICDIDKEQSTGPGI